MTNEQLEQRVAALERTVVELQHKVTFLAENGDGDEPPIELTDELKAEIQRRLADAEANPHDSYSWEEVKAAALARFQKK